MAISINIITTKKSTATTSTTRNKLQWWGSWLTAIRGSPQPPAPTATPGSAESWRIGNTHAGWKPNNAKPHAMVTITITMVTLWMVTLWMVTMTVVMKMVLMTTSEG